MLIAGKMCNLFGRIHKKAAEDQKEGVGTKKEGKHRLA